MVTCYQPAIVPGPPVSYTIGVMIRSGVIILYLIPGVCYYESKVTGGSMKNAKKGFTLIELMIVVAIIGILAAIAIPKFADLINKSKEGATKGSLASVRSAIQVYYGDNEGWFPADDLACLTASAKYLSAVPVAKLPNTGHVDTGGVNTVIGITDIGGWDYANLPATPSTWGNFVVSCTHEDIKGQESTTVTSLWSTL